MKHGDVTAWTEDGHTIELRISSRGLRLYATCPYDQSPAGPCFSAADRLRYGYDRGGCVVVIRVGHYQDEPEYLHELWAGAKVAFQRLMPVAYRERLNDEDLGPQFPPRLEIEIKAAGTADALTSRDQDDLTVTLRHCHAADLGELLERFSGVEPTALRSAIDQIMQQQSADCRQWWDELAQFSPEPAA